MSRVAGTKMAAGHNQNYQTISQGPSERRDGSEEKLTPFWKKVVANNVGLLLITGSELFFAFMHLAVKILSGIDPPVTTFEVGSSYRSIESCPDTPQVDLYSNGNHLLRFHRLYGRNWGSRTILWPQRYSAVALFAGNWRVSAPPNRTTEHLTYYVT
jgi:hypothetical protein